VRVWELGSGETSKVLGSHDGGVGAVARSADGKRVASGGGDCIVRIWDLQSGEGVLAWRGDPKERISSGPTPPEDVLQELRTSGLDVEADDSAAQEVVALVFTPDDRRIVLGGADGKLRLVDTCHPGMVQTLEGHTAAIMGVALTPDGRLAVSASFDNTLRVWDLASTRLVKILEGHSAWVRAVAVTPDGRHVLSVSHDKTLRYWSLETGETEKVMEGHESLAWAVAVSPDGRRAISGSMNGMMALWDLENGQLIRRFPGHDHEIFAATVSPDGRHALTASEDRTIRVWDVERLEAKAAKGPSRDRGLPVTGLAVTPDGRRLVAARRNGPLEIWDLARRERLRVLEGGEGRGPVQAMALSSDGHRAVTSRDGAGVSLTVWDLVEKRPLRTLKAPRSVAGPGLRMLAGGKHALSATDSVLTLWDLDRGPLTPCLEGHRNRVDGVDVTPDGRWAISGSWDGSVVLWSLEHARPIRSFQGHTDMVGPVAFTPSFRFIISGSRDHTLKIWDIESGRAVHTMRGHQGPITTIAITPDGRHVVSGSVQDCSLRLWSVANGTLLSTFQGEGEFRVCTLTPDGRTVVTSDRYGRIDLFRLEGIEAGAARTLPGLDVEQDVASRSSYQVRVRELEALGGLSASLSELGYSVKSVPLTSACHDDPTSCGTIVVDSRMPIRWIREILRLAWKEYPRFTYILTDGSVVEHGVGGSITFLGLYTTPQDRMEMRVIEPADWEALLELEGDRAFWDRLTALDSTNYLV
jgi:WD40 repeat protein